MVVDTQHRHDALHHQPEPGCSEHRCMTTESVAPHRQPTGHQLCARVGIDHPGNAAHEDVCRSARVEQLIGPDRTRTDRSDQMIVSGDGDDRSPHALRTPISDDSEAGSRRNEGRNEVLRHPDEVQRLSPRPTVLIPQGSPRC